MYHKRDIERLNEDFAPLIKHFARRYGGEDMAAQLWLKLWELCASGRAISQRYVAVALRNEFIRYARELQRQPLPTDEQPAIAAADFAAEIAIKAALAELSAPERSAIVYHRISGYTFDEIARRKGCTRQAINNAEKRGLDKLRTRL